MANLITAREFYKLLIFDYRIKNLTGSIKFQLGNISVGIKRRDIIGEIIQDWVCEWLERARIDFVANPLPQTPPDIYLNPKNLRSNWLEIKAFNRADNPRFSIAAFDFFVEDCIRRPWHLDADYLIFGYSMNIETGNLRIQDLWLKKIWEITKPMKQWPLTIKTYNEMPVEIRPCTWYATKTKTKVFESLEDFLSALEAPIFQNPGTHAKASRWRNRFLKSYQKHYGHEIKIPKWEEIKHKYH
ncbi:MAG: NgoBV family restriction endonuclease [Synergistaceae bacterium]|nr:NgoBV family restriction endonuclease [Synergistaceae bacterium]